MARTNIPGILGVSFATGLAQTSPAEMAAVRPNSPAGWQDFARAIGSSASTTKPIASQTDLRFALGPRYAGETIQLKAKRGDDELERAVTLAGKMEAVSACLSGRAAGEAGICGRRRLSKSLRK